MPLEQKSCSNVIINQQLTRQDGAPVILMPHILEGDLSRFFTEPRIYPADGPSLRDSILEKYIVGKKVLVVPGYSTNAFLFKELGAECVYGIDSDPITITWLENLRDYYHYKDLGKVFMAAAHYPKVFYPAELEKLTGRSYRFDLEGYVAASLRQAILEGDPQSLQGLEFIQASLGTPTVSGERTIVEALPSDQKFDFVYVPFLVGIANGVVEEHNIRTAFAQLSQLVSPSGRMMAIPFTQGSELSQQGIAEYEARSGLVATLPTLASIYFDLEREFTFGSDIPFAILRPKVLSPM